MGFLDSLTPNERETLVSLPYKVGYWVSQADSTGGDQSSQQELEVLSNIIHAFTAEVFGSEVVQLVMAQTVANKGRWPEWAKESGSLLEDCRIALDILAEHGDAKDANAYSMRLIEIAEAVAMAFREYDRMGFIGKLRMYGSYYITTKFKKPLPGKPRKTLGEYVTVSHAERRALNALAHALGTSYA